ncbi:MAG: cupin domain-containing protein [Campylobacterales bacterium]|nr:cupin domain-containing protein [Campylobacterales bacterium]
MQKISFMDKLSFSDKPVITLIGETSHSKEIRICMAKGNMMKEHTAPGAITIMLIEGKLLLESLGEEMVLEEGEMVCFEPKIPHSLQAMEACIIRLTLAKYDSVERIQNVIAPVVFQRPDM